jgi:hypothetical protein
MNLRWTIAGLLAPLLLCQTLGCASWSYDNIQIGQAVRESQRLLPVDKTRRTDVGFCYVDQDLTGRTDAIVILLTKDLTVAGKLQASHVKRDVAWMSEEGYLLRGVIDPVAMQLNATGPVDTLRAVTDDLAQAMDDNFVREAHGWVAVGLARLIQRWPHMGIEPGGGNPGLMEMLQRVPAGGTAMVRVTPEGMYEIEYRYGKAP